jgi:hypothetical protein
MKETIQIIEWQGLASHIFHNSKPGNEQGRLSFYQRLQKR